MSRAAPSSLASAVRPRLARVLLVARSASRDRAGPRRSRCVEAWPGVAFDEPLWVGGARRRHRLRVRRRAGGPHRPDREVARRRGRRSRRCFLDIRSRRRDPQGQGGIAGVAFHPKFAQNGRFFVTYLHEEREPADPLPDRPRRVPLGERRDLRPGQREDPARDPEDASRSHNGGGLEFGPDGKLWIGTGDNRDARRTAIQTSQNRGRSSGKLLRIDVDAPAPAWPTGSPPTTRGRRRTGVATRDLGLRLPQRLALLLRPRRARPGSPRPAPRRASG